MGTAHAPTKLTTPFRGLESFRYADRAIFFAREWETRRLTRTVSVYRGIMMIGASGTGKSSLVDAGLMSSAISEGFQPERIRVQPQKGKELIVERVSTRASGKPPYLPSCFTEAKAKQSTAVLGLDEFRTALQHLPEGIHPLLIFDQFEELVTLFDEPIETPVQADRLSIQRDIVKAITDVLGAEQLPVKVLLVFREDYLAKVASLFDAVPELEQRYLRLRPPEPDIPTLLKIIRGPFDEFPDAFKSPISPELAQRVAEAFHSRAGAGFVSLSELQIVCEKLWRSAHPAKDFEKHGLQGLIEQYYTDALENFDRDLQYAAVALLARMVTASGARNVVSHDDLIERVASEEALDEKQLKHALNALQKEAHLISREARHEVIFYEIVSEYLIPWIQRQARERLSRRELDEAGAVLLLRTQDEADRQFWQAYRTRRLLRWVLVGSAVLVLAGMAVWWLAFRSVEPFLIILLAVWIGSALFNLATALQSRATKHEGRAMKAMSLGDEIREYTSTASAGLTQQELDQWKAELQSDLEDRPAES